MLRLAIVLCCAASMWMPKIASAQHEVKRPKPILRVSFDREMPNLATPTLGGTQLWTDEIYFGQWRIQCNAMTGHFRLLDPHNVRQAWGSREHCLMRLEELKAEKRIEPLRGKVIVVVHGLMSFRLYMHPLVRYLEAQEDFSVINVSYASTRATMADHASALASVVECLSEANEIHFVAHSMGNIVVRHYMGDRLQRIGHLDPRIKRFVMIGPPNHGSRCARTLDHNIVFDNIVGESAQQLADRWQEIEPHLATPPGEFGIIAGGKGNALGWNLHLPGDDDSTVSVEETRLVGANDFLLLDVHHASMPLSRTVQEATLRYLRTGAFREDQREPIVDDSPRANTR